MMQGSATNQDGRSSSLTAPNGPAQQSLILSALQACASAVPDIGLLATHGTGTPLGDPIETGAIGAAVSKMQSQGSSETSLMLSSIKARYGHTEGTAGKSCFLHVHHSKRYHASLLQYDESDRCKMDSVLGSLSLSTAL